MAVVHEPLATPARSRPPWWQQREIWGTFGIVTVWLAVLFVGVYGGDMRFAGSDGSASSIPVVAVVAVCAIPASLVVAKSAFHR
jgi:hypothetical protein